ncbi:MAG: ceramidase domain-containing protein [Burkholderiales bacterium]
MDYIDLYCERIGPGLWAEPVNALTNAAFFLAVWLLWRSARRAELLSAPVALLLTLVLAIGIGSALFHTFATTWARVLDELPILLFQLLFVWVYARRVMGLRPFAAGTILIAFFAAALYGRQFPHLLNGSLVYAPAVILVCVLGAFHYATHKPARAHLLLAAGVLAAAVGLRTLDASVCDWFALGTHFLWHALVATVIYLCMSALFAVLNERSGTAA